MSALLAAGRSYESLLVANATRISSIESSLRSLTWFLPGRFKDSELASEAREFLLSFFFSGTGLEWAMRGYMSAHKRREKVRAEIGLGGAVAQSVPTAFWWQACTETQRPQAHE